MGYCSCPERGRPASLTGVQVQDHSRPIGDLAHGMHPSTFAIGMMLHVVVGTKSESQSWT